MASKFLPGAVLRIPVTEEKHTYARMLARPPHVAFYDHLTSSHVVDLASVMSAPVLFVLAVSCDQAIMSGRWPKVGKISLEEAQQTIPDQFMQDISDFHAISIMNDRGRWRLANYNECIGLERVAVWDWDQVEDRLIDHYAGRKNKNFESMRIKRPD